MLSPFYRYAMLLAEINNIVAPLARKVKRGILESEAIMKLAILALALLFMSCSPFGLNPLGYDVLHTDLDTAWQRVASMKYIPETGDYWKSPREFFRDGGGDCEDFAIALLYLLGEGEMYIYMDDRIGLHSIVKYKGFFYEPQDYGRFRPDPQNSIWYIYDYDASIWRATIGGVKGS
jgi:hypothetical protein